VSCTRSHDAIGVAISEARDGLDRATSLSWQIDRDSHYQLSNRVAWSWKVATLGVPVVLVYLGFLRAHEMADLGTPFADHADWEQQLRAHAVSSVPDTAWETSWGIDGASFTLLIRSFEQALPAASSN
jgi:hypothetical protein